jgi:hypothetical protein
MEFPRFHSQNRQLQKTENKQTKTKLHFFPLIEKNEYQLIKPTVEVPRLFSPRCSLTTQLCSYRCNANILSLSSPYPLH